MRILVVEDEPGIADFVRQGLTEAGYAVDLAWDGRDDAGSALSSGLYLVRVSGEAGGGTARLVLLK